MSEQRPEATTGGGDDPDRTQAFDVGDTATVDLQKPDDGPWRTVPLDATAVPTEPSAGQAPVAGRAEQDELTGAGAARAETLAAAVGSGRTGTPDDARPVGSGAAESRSAGPGAAGIPTDAPDAQVRSTAAPRAGVPRPAAGPQRVGRAASGSAASGARARRARLRLARIDPWSVLLLSLLVSLFLAVVVVVAVVALYAVLEAAGVPDSVNALVAEVTRTPGEAEPEPLLSAGRALRAAGVIAVVDVVLLTALSTLSAVLYNLCASFTGGLEVTLAEDA